jgi:hypothetical protein
MKSKEVDSETKKSVNNFLSNFKSNQVIGFIGGTNMIRGSPMYKDIALISRKLIRNNFTVISNGGIEAVHLGAFFSTRSVLELNNAINMLSRIPNNAIDEIRLTAYEIIYKLPNNKNSSDVAFITYENKKITPFASYIVKFYNENIKDEMVILSSGTIIIIPDDKEYILDDDNKTFLFYNSTFWKNRGNNIFQSLNTVDDVEETLSSINCNCRI